MLGAALNAVRQVYATIRRRIDAFLFDRPAGLDTADFVRLNDLGLGGSGRQDYHATPSWTLRHVFSEKDMGRDDVFIDLGCGKGRVLIHAAARPFRRVIGVELSPELAEIARRNIAAASPGLACKDVEVVVADVTQYVIPDDVTFVYLFDPFHGDIFAAALRNLLESLRRRPRELTIIYFDPHEEEALLGAGARLVRRTWGMRPTRTWAKENSIRVYKLGPPV